MVGYLRLTMLLLLVCMNAAYAMQPSFSVILDTHQVEYGKSVKLILETTRTTPSLDQLSLNGLEKNFVVETGYSAGRATDAGGQRREVRLYPRHSGSLAIPALHFQELNSQPITLQVSQAIDHKTNTPIRIMSRIDSQDVWFKQAIKLTMQFETSAPVIVLDSEPARIDNIQILQIPVDHRPAVNGSNNSLHRIGWILYPTRVGSHQLQLPAIRYIRDGVTTHRFYPPPLKLKVRPLPRYVPATMPVGNVTLDMRLPDKWFVQAGKLQYLSILLRGEGIRQQDLPSLEQQFKSTDAIKYYPASTNDKVLMDFFGLTSIREYHIPFVTQTSNVIHPSALRIQYFDPDSGRIVTRQEFPGSVISINRWWVFTGLALLLAVLWRLYRYLTPKTKTVWLRYQNYLSAMTTLEQEKSTDAIKAAIQKIACAESWPTNLTFAAWYKHWSLCHGEDDDLQQVIEKLQQHRYGGGSVDFDWLRKQLTRSVLHRYRLLRFLYRFRQAA